MNDRLNTELFASVNSNAVYSSIKNRHAKILKDQQIQHRADFEFGLYSIVFAATVLFTGFVI